MSVHTGETRTVYVFHRAPMEALELRMRGEYREMPGMRLKVEQAMRLWSLDRSTCQEALDDLVQQGFLKHDDTGHYARAHSGY